MRPRAERVRTGMLRWGSSRRTNAGARVGGWIGIRAAKGNQDDMKPDAAPSAESEHDETWCVPQFDEFDDHDTGNATTVLVVASVAALIGAAVLLVIIKRRGRADRHHHLTPAAKRAAGLA